MRLLFRKYRFTTKGRIILGVSLLIFNALHCARLLANEVRIEPEKELATYMGELQRLTHKLNLAVYYRNPKLSDFYLHECLHMLEEIKNDVPLYEGLPIALFIDRYMTPAFENMQSALANNKNKHAWKETSGAMEKLVQSCNRCHTATKFEFIEIVRTHHNPFNQNFNVNNK